MQQTVNDYSQLETVKNDWDKKAKYYQDYNEQTTFPSGVTLANMLEISKAKHIVEMGCASGLFSLYYMKTFNNAETYTAYDISDKMIELAKENKAKTEGLNKTTKQEFIAENAEDLSFIKEESVDLYIGNFFLHLVPDANKALQEAYRILQKGAKIGMSLPVPEKGSIREIFLSSFKEVVKSFSEKRSPFYLSSKEALIKILQDNGFEIMYCWEDKIRVPFSTEEEVDLQLSVEYFGSLYQNLDEGSKKEIRSKIMKELQTMKDGYVAPFRSTLSIVAKKPL